MSDKWICDHADTCTNYWCVNREPTNKPHSKSISLLWSGFHCDQHNKNLKSKKAPFVKYVLYKEAPMEYEIIKSFSCEAVFYAGMTGDDLRVFVDKWRQTYGWTSEIPKDLILPVIQKSICARIWAIKHEFIKVKEPEVFYKIGDRFRIGGEGEYLLCRIAPNKVVLINTESGNRVKQPISVHSNSKITKLEIKEAFGCFAEYYEKIT